LQNLVLGQEYVVDRSVDGDRVWVVGGTVGWRSDRFRAVVENELLTDPAAAATPARVRMTAGELSHLQVGHQVTFADGSHPITATLLEVIHQGAQTRLLFAGIRPPKPHPASLMLGVKETTTYRLDPRETVLVDSRDEVEALAELVLDETSAAPAGEQA
jgi:hypothetical protein